MNRYQNRWIRRSLLDYSIDKNVHKALKVISDNDSLIGVWKLMMMLETNWNIVKALVALLVRNNLINIVVELDSSLNSRPSYSITQKGRQLLSLLDKQSKILGG